MTQQRSAIQFPCDFTIKIVGKSGKSFEKAVLDILQKYYPTLTKKRFKKRLSRDANYLGLTVTLSVLNKEVLDAIYTDLSACPQVIMAL